MLPIVASKNLSWISTANFQECTTFPDRLRCESIAYWRHFLEASVIAVFWPSAFKNNWIELNTEAAKKFRHNSCLYTYSTRYSLSLVFPVSCWQLLPRWAKLKRCSLCCGVFRCRRLLCCSRKNFNSAFCCCSGRVLPGEDLHPLLESRIVVLALVGHWYWRNLLVIHR